MPIDLDNYAGLSGIYGLADPRTNRVMYVGKSFDIERRFREHLAWNYHSTNASIKIRFWLGELLREGLTPKLCILLEVPVGNYTEMDREEKRLIHEYRVKGEAELNEASGGSGCSISRVSKTSKDDWMRFAERLSQLRADIENAAEMAGSLAGADGCDQILMLRDRLDKSRLLFQKKIEKVFPEWADFSNYYLHTRR